ncbi:light-inducible protein CPRF2 isoform X1 [Setaria viridis]|uniref:light-inducible protein CPRF2 isoform X1 n=2 Tax=Setaria viridis TaxID=4556 RepID=UPI001493B1A3|nr:light-inducible protein CPRF2-like isoform X1 [Setaria viridis]
MKTCFYLLGSQQMLSLPRLVQNENQNQRAFPEKSHGVATRPLAPQQRCRYKRGLPSGVHHCSGCSQLPSFPLRPSPRYEVRERKRLSSEHGGRLRRRRRGGGELRRGRPRPRRLRGGAQEEARPVLRRRRQIHDDGDGADLVTNSNIIDYDDFRGKPANSGTSKEQSDDDGDLEENTDPTNTKKMRRMLSNRESARRSRKRKQEHLTDLESQVSRLTSENASLLKRLADMTQKYKDATLDNRNLIVDVETMRRKVNIAEEAVRRLTGTTLLLPTTSDKPASSMRLTSCASDAASASVAIEDSMEHFLRAPFQDSQTKLDLPNAEIPLASGEIGTKLAPMRRVASLENLQKRMHGDSLHSETASTFSSDPESFAHR